MTLYDDYRNTDYLDDVSFIAGTEFTLNFPVHNSYGTPLNVNASSMKWVLSRYGQPEIPILQKDCVISASSVFSLTLKEEDTIDLGDTYLQQLQLTDFYGKVIRPAQGIVVIRKAIPIT